MRNVTQNDLEDLFELSGKVQFINLPHDKRIIQDKITKSLTSFTNPNTDFSENYYIFVIEDLEAKKVIGVSMIHAQHGTELEPHFFLRVAHENKYSSTINTGFVHGTLKLGLDTNGPTEIGGLVLHPDYRGNTHKLGKQISFVRFLYMAFNQDRFKEIIHSELMPPLDQNGHSPLWEAIGRRFMNMEYNEADKLSRSNKEFIVSLFPNDNIYMTLLPMEARNSIGKVGRDTAPVKKMLEGIGFQYINEVDPFDGGPHYRSKLNNIRPIRNKKALKYNEDLKFDESTAENFLISIKKEGFQFYSIKTQASVDETSISFSKSFVDRFEINSSDTIEIIPF
jgi:arginine N-succinyltransferase